MTTIFDYLISAEGTRGAVCKEFKLYGMNIGKFVGVVELVSSPVSLLFERAGETMYVPLSVSLPDILPHGSISNPVLVEITEI